MSIFFNFMFRDFTVEVVVISEIGYVINYGFFQEGKLLLVFIGFGEFNFESLGGCMILLICERIK